jgi:crossover junction endodeoxyribonuclease RuvC
MIIIGIDPGSVIVGYSVLKKNTDKSLEVLDFGCIITNKFATTGEKLKHIHKNVLNLIETHKPDVMSIETLFFFKNLKTVMPVSQTKGVILLAAANKKIPVMEFTPLQVKMAIAGYGRAEKKQVQKMIEEMLDLKSFDLKKNNRKKDDAYDALGVALCASFKAY